MVFATVSFMDLERAALLGGFNGVVLLKAISRLEPGKSAPTAAQYYVREPAEVTRALFGETLSVVIHEPTGTVGATTPLGHHVTFWDMKSGKLRKTLRVPNPRGIALTLSGDEIVINFGSPPRAARVRADTLEPVDAEGNRRGYLSLATGSHISLV